jgi:acyl dehydratase
MTTSLTRDDFDTLTGTHLGFSEWIEIDQARVDLFAEATGDHQWIHVDEERAAAGPFGGTIAHGYLTLSLLPSFLGASGFCVGNFCPDPTRSGMIWSCAIPSSTATCWVSRHRGM